VITGYRVALDPAAVGLGITAMVSIWQTDNSDVDVVADELAEVPEIEDCWMVAGDENFVVLVRVAAMVDLTRVVSRIRRCPGVSRTRTTVVLASCWEGRSSIAREPEAEPGEWQPAADLEVGD
jgi:Lrp/AsnC family leucine-responsive transcriptional regulator